MFGGVALLHRGALVAHEAHRKGPIARY
jgi:hypothetical protein